MVLPKHCICRKVRVSPGRNTAIEALFESCVMSSNKPWLNGPSKKEQAKERMWQGGLAFLMGLISTAGLFLLLGIVWSWTVIIGVGGLFWFLTGAVTYYTGVE